MKRFIYLILLFFYGTNLYASDDFVAATVAAEKGYESFLELCLSAKDAHQRHHLSKDDGIKNASLGKPYVVKLLTTESIQSYKPGTTIHHYFTDNATFLFPVLFDGEMKLMITVRKYSPDGEYKIGALGDRLLAKDLKKIESAWGKFKTEKNQDNPILCLNQKTRIYAFHIPQKDDTNLTAIGFSIQNEKNDPLYRILNSADNTMSQIAENLAVVLEGGSKW